MSRFSRSDDYACLLDVPLHRVRGNQLGILLFIVAAVSLQQLWLLVIPLVVQVISRQFGVKYNIFVRTLSPLFPTSTKTESRVLLRFNNLLAMLFLAVALVGYALDVLVLSYVALAMLTGAVVLALSGFCLGCFMYFQWRQFIARRQRKLSS